MPRTQSLGLQGRHIIEKAETHLMQSEYNKKYRQLNKEYETWAIPPV
jgi:hypothetical protein